MTSAICWEVDALVPVRIPLLTALFVILVGSAGAQSPDRLLWDSFLDRPIREASIPEDEELGLLANLRNPDPAWVSAITVSEQVFSALADGRIPDESMSPERALPLRLALESALQDDGRLNAGRRYGRPERSGDRLTIPVRLSGSNGKEYGHIYMVRRDGVWLLEQWALDITRFIAVGEP